MALGWLSTPVLILWVSRFQLVKPQIRQLADISADVEVNSGLYTLRLISLRSWFDSREIHQVSMGAWSNR